LWRSWTVRTRFRVKCPGNICTVPVNPADVELIAVFFKAGARTRPHTHAPEQTLHVLEGEGIVATQDDVRIVVPGDIVVVPAGRWHWHGATPDSSLMHLSIKALGSTDMDVALGD
jgi:quercetin dioxygenase-like cupin family protein